MNDDKEKQPNIFTIMGISNEYPLERPKDLANLHVIFWKRAEICIPWLEGRSAKESILYWAFLEAAKENKN